MKIAVIGASGMTGAAIVDELSNRRHQVSGIGRNADKIARRDGVTAIAADIMNVREMATALSGHDAVVCAYAAGHTLELDVYKNTVEAAWRIKRAIKAAGSPYLVFLGGVGSLWTEGGEQVLDEPRWPAWYLETASPAYLRHLHAMTHIDAFELMAAERESIIASGDNPHAPFKSEVAHHFIAAMGTSHQLAQGCRAAWEIFADDRSFEWTFVSPPWFLMYGPRTGSYETVADMLPLKGGTPAGISVDDMAIAVADEAENHAFKYRHWSAMTDLR
ncbi:MAG: NAD(P)H-binding protein [Parvularculaceae bacterium]